MSALHWLNVVVTFALFAGACTRLLQTPRPGKCRDCQLQFVLWAAAHIAVVVTVGMIFMDNITGPMREITLRYLVLKAAIAVLFLFPWKPKAVGL